MVCPVGQFLNMALDPDACEACPIGTYQDHTGTNYCVQCEFGYTTTAEGATAESQCTRETQNSHVLLLTDVYSRIIGIHVCSVAAVLIYFVLLKTT